MRLVCISFFIRPPPRQVLAGISIMYFIYKRISGSASSGEPGRLPAWRSAVR